MIPKFSCPIYINCYELFCSTCPHEALTRDGKPLSPSQVFNPFTLMKTHEDANFITHSFTEDDIEEADNQPILYTEYV